MYMIAYQCKPAVNNCSDVNRTFFSQDQSQLDQDFGIKTKIKTSSCALEVPRDQNLGLES